MLAKAPAADVLFLYSPYSCPNSLFIRNSSLCMNILNMRYTKHGIVNSSQEFKNKIIPGRIRNITWAKRGFLHTENTPVVINSFFLYAVLSAFKVITYKGTPTQSKKIAAAANIL